MVNKDSTTVLIRSVGIKDYGEMFTLQRAAFVDEGRLYQSLDTPALNETFDKFISRISNSTSWVAIDKNRIVGGVCLRIHQDVLFVERLMVAPDRRGEGIGSKLLRTSESAALDAGHQSLCLVVGDLAVNLQRFYEHCGWKRTNSYQVPDYEHVILHEMEKQLAVTDEYQ